MASDARVLFQLKPLTSLLPPQAAALTQDYHTLNRLLGLQRLDGDSVKLDLGFDIIEQYEKKAADVEAKKKETEERAERILKVQEKVAEKEQEYFKTQIDKFHQENKKRIEEEEQRRIEAEKKQKEQQSQLVASLMAQTGLKTEQARELLVSKGWNYSQAMAEIKEQERRETMTLQFLQTFPDVDFDQAKTILMQYGWNYDYAVQQYRHSKSFKIKFVFIAGQAYPNNGAPDSLESEFIPTDDAVVMYTFIDQMRPLPPSTNLYYKLYRDPSCSPASKLTFMESMQKFSVLKIQSGSTFYVKKDNEPHL